MRGPRWWVLYLMALSFVALVLAIEVSVPEGALRKILEIATLLVAFPLMAIWGRCNRVAFDLERGSGIRR